MRLVDGKMNLSVLDGEVMFMIRDDDGDTVKMLMQPVEALKLAARLMSVAQQAASSER